MGVNGITHNRQLYCVKRLLKIAKDINPLISVLDCPCGSGRFSVHLTEYKLTCADVSEKRLIKAKSIVDGNNVKFKCCDLFNMSFDDSSYDLILTAFVLQHIKKEKLSAIFQELLRVTKSWVIISYSSKFSLGSLYRSISGKKNNVLTSNEFTTLCNMSGFTVIKEMYTFPFITTSKIALLQKTKHLQQSQNLKSNSSIP